MRRLALVGGSSSGIGLGIAEGLLEAGMDVILTARGADKLAQAQKRLEDKHPSAKVHPIAADFASSSSVEALIGSVRKLGRPVDVLVLNTGGPKPGTFSQTSLADWDGAYQQLFRSHAALLKALVPPMVERRWGRVICVSSTLMLEPTAAMALSCGMRALLANALKALSLETAKDNVTVNTVCPGAVLTDRLVSLFQKEGESREETAAKISKNIPMGRIASPKEFAELCVFLASDKAGFITGTAIPVDGGMTKKGW